MVTTTPKGTKTTVKHPDSMMTPAQIARRKFKSMLPRTPQKRTLTPLQALGETCTRLDQFLSMVMAEKKSKEAANTVYAALAYSMKDGTKLAYTLTVPESEALGTFCDKVMLLDTAEFLGIVFVQVDPDTTNAAYKAVSFVVPFTSGPDAVARLHFAQETELLKIQTKIQERNAS